MSGKKRRVVLPDAHYRGVSCREWFEKRFKRKPESDPIYYMEWRDRFLGKMNGTAWQYMDLESRRVFKRMLKKGR